VGQELIERERVVGLSQSAQDLTRRKLAKVNAGEHDVFI
jgi:hypothetical protein